MREANRLPERGAAEELAGCSGVFVVSSDIL